MGRFSHNGNDRGGTSGEEFHDAMREAGPVECFACKVKLGQGIKGMNIHVCKSCIEYFCDEHHWRHANCENGK